MLSGNRNFEGRIHPDCRMNYLASPPLVVAYALAGTMDIDLTPIRSATTATGAPVYLRDLWPSDAEITSVVESVLDRSMFVERYGSFLDGDERWRALAAPTGDRYEWDPESTYIRRPPFLDGVTRRRPADQPTSTARACSRCSATASRPTTSRRRATSARRRPAGQWLIEHGVEPRDFNSYGARRGNHEVMVRGTFANVRLRNQLAPGTEGGVHRAPPRRRADHDLRRRDAVRARGRAARRDRGQGVRLGLVARLGGQGLAAARRARRARRELRAHPPLEPRRDGRAAARVRRRASRPRRSGSPATRSTAIVGRRGAGRPTARSRSTVTVDADDRAFTMRVRIDTPFERQVFRAGGILACTLRAMLA